MVAGSATATLDQQGKRKRHLACQTIRRSRIMSARTEPCGESVILTATLSLSYALRILFLYRVLYVFKGLAPSAKRENRSWRKCIDLEARYCG